MNDALGDRMKSYEAREDRRFMPLLPVIARLDGRAFHGFCRGLQKPFDDRLVALMGQTAMHVMDESNALVAYTQSDEISLLFYSDDPKSQIFFDGRVQKMTSVLPAIASVYFNEIGRGLIPERAGSFAVFDCRVWQVPTKEEAANTFLWREQDATKNSIAMAASAYYSHDELIGKSSSQKLDMLMAKGVNWNEYPSNWKRGAFFRRERIARPFTGDEIERLPAKHEARTNPGLIVERSMVRYMSRMPPFGTVTNRVEVLFDGAEPARPQTSLGSFTSR